jgi:hypothetical protein
MPSWPPAAYISIRQLSKSSDIHHKLRPMILPILHQCREPPGWRRTQGSGAITFPSANLSRSVGCRTKNFFALFSCRYAWRRDDPAWWWWQWSGKWARENQGHGDPIIVLIIHTHSLAVWIHCCTTYLGSNHNDLISSWWQMLP